MVELYRVILCTIRRFLGAGEFWLRASGETANMMSGRVQTAKERRSSTQRQKIECFFSGSGYSSCFVVRRYALKTMGVWQPLQSSRPLSMIMYLAYGRWVFKITSWVHFIYRFRKLDMGPMILTSKVSASFFLNVSIIPFDFDAKSR